MWFINKRRRCGAARERMKGGNHVVRQTRKPRDSAAAVEHHLTDTEPTAFRPCSAAVSPSDRVTLSDGLHDASSMPGSLPPSPTWEQCTRSEGSGWSRIVDSNSNGQSSVSSSPCSTESTAPMSPDGSNAALPGDDMLQFLEQCLGLRDHGIDTAPFDLDASTHQISEQTRVPTSMCDPCSDESEMRWQYLPDSLVAGRPHLSMCREYMATEQDHQWAM